MATREPVDATFAGRPPRPSVTKGTFFCPECPYRSRFDGDWTILTTDHGVRYLCPDCEAEVTARRTSFDDAPDAGRPHTD